MLNILPLETWLFIAVILAYFIYSNQNFTEKKAHESPGILITIGILATFLGIALGLASFDMNDVENSLPKLINGIKTAFWASVVGVACALIIKWRYAFRGVRTKNNQPTPTDSTIDDIVQHLQLSTESIGRLHYAIAGNEDASLLTQLKLMRGDQNDKLTNIHNAFIEFSRNQTENNSKALIEALKEVIHDFNEKIGEQFGDNFKQLNEAVGKINEWQQQYSLQMREMIEQQTQTTENMQQATQSFSEIMTQSESFTQVAKDIHQTIGTASSLEKGIEENLKQLAELIESSKTGIPEIEKGIMAIIEDVRNGATASATVIGDSIYTVTQTLESSAADFTSQMIGSSKAMSDAIKNQNQEMQKSVQQTGTELQEQITRLSQDLTKYIQRHNEDVTNNIVELNKKTEQQVQTLDAALAAALKKSLDSLGQQLGALSSKFVQDYDPLTEKLRDVVRLSENLRG
ncbi:hypothetical protein LHL03_21125 [Pectobacterium carotovorum]|uniref:hypothetical protein n=1 Tax=Pectobacterium carotovorum TaxID=554 RepID=UPI0010FCF95D|nr:hypothetical protein [Pectobacterium carotovorum]KAA3669578.1 hypothetical protein FEV48_01070 [Pectobacterium carotovorum subsp. carotovorum]UCZ79457.1 hypothetical protein LHL03_21125 [Pectobacterium carotovorum]